MDEREGFFKDLRALRARRGLSLADIAERTRFPADTLADAESGPDLPSLPALEAYLRGCGEPLAQWEDRWRRLGADADAGLRPAGLPVREAGASPLAAAGAAAGEAATTPGLAAYTIKRLGPGRGRGRGRAKTAPRRALARGYAIAAVGAALLTAGAVTLVALSSPAGHGGLAAPAAGAPGGGERSAPAPAPGAPSPHRGPGGPGGRRTWAVLEVAGIGCPRSRADGVTVASAPAGPGWTLSDGGWTGDGCDGSTVWTMNPNGNQSITSALTWRFGLTAGVSYCTLAVFVPTRNAFGVGDYAVFADDAGTGMDLATVPVSQATAAGQWVTLGSYPVRGGASLEIEVVPAAVAPGDPGPGAHGRHHATGLGPGHQSAIAASAARAACA